MRSPNQVMIGFWAESDLAAKIDAARGSVPRSQFLRIAVAKYLRARGIDVPDQLISAPDRIKIKVGDVALQTEDRSAILEAIAEAEAAIDRKLGIPPGSAPAPLTAGPIGDIPARGPGKSKRAGTSSRNPIPMQAPRVPDPKHP